MGSLGLTGEKATRRIGALSGGEKARVALAVFCLTPCNVVLFDEPSNHLDVFAIEALVSALDEYEGCLVVISHDRAFCEAIRCSHVAYVANGRVSVEERELRPSDFRRERQGCCECRRGARGGGGGGGGGERSGGGEGGEGGGEAITKGEVAGAKEAEGGGEED